VAEVKADLGGVKEELGEVRQDVSGMKQEFAEFKQEQAQIKQEVMGLSEWRRGLDGRLAGEQYERQTVARAARILGAGEGGSPRDDPAVRRQVIEWLAQGGVLEEDGDEENEPLWADLIWWKGNHVVVAEISIKVNGVDVLRAKRRAETLRKAGVDAIPAVIGREWAHAETPALAEQEGVEWAVEGKYSDGLIAFRRIPPT
ncbi:MAG: hypothetical protein N2554_08485, partial [Fimbriimonadales bacterium]|nr:hypothetical protein [Fimbriimonadales bacterium]